MVYQLGRIFLLRRTQATRMMMLMPLIMLGVGVVVGVALLLTRGPVLPGVVIFPIWLAVLAYVATRYLGFPHTIDWSAEGTITFRSYIRSTRVSPGEIVSIEPAQ